MLKPIKKFLDSEPGVVEVIVMTLLCLAFVLWARG
jgi:hypothetical protein